MITQWQTTKLTHQLSPEQIEAGEVYGDAHSRRDGFDVRKVVILADEGSRQTTIELWSGNPKQTSPIVVTLDDEVWRLIANQIPV